MKIPKNAKEVFKGIIFDVYHWEQKLFDKKQATFEMVARIPTAEVIGIVNNKIMIQMQQQPTRLKPYPSLPGGRLEKDEKPIQAAKREFLEETGYGVKNIKLFRKYYGTSKVYYPEYVYIAKECVKIREPQLDSGERIKTKLVSFDQFLNLCRNPEFSTSTFLRFEMYEALIDKRKRKVFKEALLS